MSPRTVKSLISILVVLGLAVWAILANDPVLGLDLQGGVTMRYELQPPPDLPAGTDVSQMISSTIDTLRERIDVYGIKESGMTRQGTNEVVIELPGKSKSEAETIKSVISRVGRLEFRLVASDDTKNHVLVDDERKRLEDLLKANEGKGPDEIDVSVLDRRFPEVLYRWVPYSDKILASHRRDPSIAPNNFDPNDPKQRLAKLEDLKAADPQGRTMGDQPLTVNDYLLVKKETSPVRTFTGADIAQANASQDPGGGRAVGIKLRGDRASDFGDMTGENIGGAMCILLDDRVAQPPANIKDKLTNEFIIQSGGIGGFKDAELKDYLTVIRSGSLQMKPRLLYENTIGPTLGESAIKAGVNASIAGLLVVVIFMIAYYRWHGVHATITLLANCTVLAGILLLLGATVTLPGLAGLILTFGIAVDANILIYERMREEKDRAHSPAQVVKLGFEKALATIVDSHVTAFITALVLYKLGTGPVRGFAVVLMLGLITSIWSALIVGRTMYEMLMDTGRMKVIGSMARFVRPDLKIGFMRIGFACLRASLVLVLISIISVFFANRDKLFGLDFLGGYKAQVRLQKEVAQAEVKQRIEGISPDFADAQIVSVADDQTGTTGLARQFVIKVKGSAHSDTEEAAATGSHALAERYEHPIKAALGELLLPDFVTDFEAKADEAADNTHVAGVMHFERGKGSPDPAKVAAHLALVSQLQVAPVGDDSVHFDGIVNGVGLDEQLFVQRLKTALDNKLDVPPPSTPLLESTTIGSRVGTELRDSALRALLISFIGIVLYLKLRFREYRYGLAAVIALVHDTAIALGVVVLVNQMGWLDIEIDLPMIAAFLTIIGYSMNDTIVLFDRVRENLPRMNAPLYDVIDASMNQVLARSLLTSFTVMLTLIVIFVMNIGKRNVLEGFSFCMIIGVIVGTYSSIYVASPFLLIFSSAEERKANQAAQQAAKHDGKHDETKEPDSPGKQARQVTG
jgi:SecD/SecF fusion protein